MFGLGAMLSTAAEFRPGKSREEKAAVESMPPGLRHELIM
jgi:hypothetical protein